MPSWEGLLSPVERATRMLSWHRARDSLCFDQAPSSSENPFLNRAEQRGAWVDPLGGGGGRAADSRCTRVAAETERRITVIAKGILSIATPLIVSGSALTYMRRATMPNATRPGRRGCTSVIRICFALGLAAWLPASAAGQSVLYVDDNAPNDPGPGNPLVSDPSEDGTINRPFDAIQEGIDAAASGWTTVVVLDGNYTGTGNVNLSFRGKAITVRSQNGPETCLITCGMSDVAACFDEYETSTTVFEGFTITNAMGGYCGIACGGWGYPSSPTIRRCIFHGNGYGLRVTVGYPTVTNCLFYDNVVAVVTSWEAPAAQVDLVNCTITNNGTGFYHDAYHTQCFVYNCILWGNGNDIVMGPDAMLVVEHSDIPSYYFYCGSDNIDAAPLFEGPNYRLSYGSLCVDSGYNGYVDMTYDLAGSARIFDTSVDMGAYEGCVPGKASNPSPGDGAAEVSLSPVLSWSDAGSATSYDVYLGTSPSVGQADFRGNQPGTSYQVDPGHVLEQDTTYYWRVDARNPYGVATGNVWHFRTASAPSDVIYVNAAATGLNNGRSWKNAYTRLQDALVYHDHADIWVAKGTYKPDRDAAHPNGSGDRAASFWLAHSVYLYGGFEGIETSRYQAQPGINLTILSGDLAGNDGPNFANNTENSYHVVQSSCRFTALIGFTITGGNANGSGSFGYGGGMLNGEGTQTEPVEIRDCRFIGNSARLGGGLYTGNSSPYLINCVFSGNSGSDGGGGLYNTNGSPSVSNCTFFANTSGYSYGYAIYNGNSSNMTVTNCVLWGSLAPFMGNTQIYNASNITVTYSCIQGGWAGTGNISSDPRLLSDLRARRGSPCIDAGNNGALPSGITLDLGGQPRFTNAPDMPDTGSGNAPLVDMGAYEYQPAAGRWLYVNSTALPAADGLSWATAYRYLQDALTAARNDPAVIEIWVAGTHKPDQGGGQQAGDRTAGFLLVPGVAIRGGFAGNEDPATFDLGDRDFAAHPTTLSGDLGGNDGANFTNYGENSYHIVVDASYGSAGTLDGFTLSGGNGNSTDGGGMYSYMASPTISNCAFRANYTTGNGGGLFNHSGNPRIANCTFTGNRAFTGGGGIFSTGNASISYAGYPLISNCIFAANTCSSGDGGGLCSNGGGPSINNCTFAANTSGSGGGVSSRSSSMTLTNCVLWGNGGAQIVRSGAVTVTYSCIQGGWEGVGNISADPRFADAARADFHLRPDSPCVDAGDPVFAPTPGQVDIDGQPRLMREHVDMGADELSWVGDIDDDGHVDVEDLLLLAASFGKRDGDPGFDLRCDLNVDGVVDVSDLLILAGNWGT
jgi:predicted outer membrane repeat protein